MIDFEISKKEEMPQIVEKEKEFTNEEKIIKMMEKSGWKFGQGFHYFLNYEFYKI